ncbi:penicillin-binding protein 1A [Paracoccus contaminans]|uniref:Penicillin-binding protein 1A n=1 Tax=Paracoccus contaminans TaxID=1945662 RepID=A0A1W6CUL7_9RHOB|nr:PBP1A family penicillin-binding protein [Paracoccus contaminans]ARJ68568.1 penicillin-binding protein [Paracoccus contaminans]
MIRFVLNFVGAVFSWFVTASVFLALTIGGIFWIYSRDLPGAEELTRYAPKTISRIYSGEGRLIDEFAEERRIFVPIGEMPDMVKQAFISAEDKNFYTHQGYDPRGMAAAAVEMIRSRGESARGASTITQQVAKNFFLSADRTAERKIKELIIASRLTKLLSKDKILELYLNEIFLGQNSYGVGAAAQTYFNKPLSDLAPHEAALLAAMPQAPSRSVLRDREQLTERRNYVLREMWQNGYLTEDTYKAEAALPLKSVQGGDYPAFRNSLPPRDYFTDEIRRQLSAQFGTEEFFGGGLSIRATVEPQLQKIAAKALQDALERYDRGIGLWRGTGQVIPPDQLDSEEHWRAALARAKVPRDIEGWLPAVVLSLGRTDAVIGIEGVANDAPEAGARGHIIPAADVQWARKMLPRRKRAPQARVASDLLSVGDVVLVRRMVDDGSRKFIRWTLRQVPGIEGGFMAMDVNTGRVYAMQGGFSYQSSVFNRATQAQRQPGSAFKPFVYAAALDNGYTPATIVADEPITVNTPQGLWTPKNSGGGFYGPVPLRTGIEQSRNLMTIRIAQDIGMQTVARYAERFGVYDKLAPFLANSLGAQETTLFKMVAAYAMFANGGERVEPTLVDRVQDRWGRTVYRHDKRLCRTCDMGSLPAGTAPVIASDRERVMDAITAYQLTSMLEGVVKRGSGKGVKLPVPVAGKTGTTNDAKDVWFIGFTSNMVAGCYLGYDDPRSLGSNAYGGTLCVPVFNAFMRQAVKQYGGTKFKVPPGGYFADVSYGKGVISEYFRNGTSPSSGQRVVDGGFQRVPKDQLPGFKKSSDVTEKAAKAVTTSTGKKKIIPKKADYGSMSSGGLY